MDNDTHDLNDEQVKSSNMYPKRPPRRPALAFNFFFASSKYCLALTSASAMIKSGRDWNNGWITDQNKEEGEKGVSNVMFLQLDVFQGRILLISFFAPPPSSYFTLLAHFLQSMAMNFNFYDRLIFIPQLNNPQYSNEF